MIRSACATVLAGAVLTLTAACGSTSSPETVNSTDHTSTDVSFAQDMIQHHAQALAMVNLTVDRPLDPAFKALATQIRDAQAPEIETMADWLDAWGEKIPETVNDHEHADMGTMPDGMDDMPGMMTADEMAGLAAAPDATFESTWLDMMVRHHRGAIEMAEAEVEDGRYQPAIDLARSIIAAQRAEIETMNGLLARS